MSTRTLLGIFSALALVSVVGYLGIGHLERKRVESPDPRYQTAKPREKPSFSFLDLQAEAVTYHIQVDYALIYVKRPTPTKLELESLDNPVDKVFESIKNALMSVPKSDAKAWQGALTDLETSALSDRVEVVGGGTSSYLHRSRFSLEVLRVKCPPQKSDPLKVQIDQSFLLMPAKKERLIGFTKGGVQTIFPGYEPEAWRMFDIENGAVQIGKSYESRESYNVVAFRFGSSVVPNVMPISGGGYVTPAPTLKSLKKDRGALVEHYRQGILKARNYKPEAGRLPRLE